MACTVHLIRCLWKGNKLFSASVISEYSLILSFHFCFGPFVLPTNCTAFLAYLTAPPTRLCMCSTIYDHCGLAKYLYKGKNRVKKRSSIVCRGINKINYSGKKATASTLALASALATPKWQNGQLATSTESNDTNQSRKSQEQQRIEI